MTRFGTKFVKLEKVKKKDFIKEIDKATKKMNGPGVWDDRVDTHMKRGKFSNVLEIISKCSDKKKVETVENLIAYAEVGNNNARDAILTIAEGHSFFGNDNVKLVITEYAKKVAEANQDRNAPEALFLEDTGLRTVKYPNRKLRTA